MGGVEKELEFAEIRGGEAKHKDRIICRRQIWLDPYPIFAVIPLPPFPVSLFPLEGSIALIALYFYV